MTENGRTRRPITGQWKKGARMLPLLLLFCGSVRSQLSSTEEAAKLSNGTSTVEISEIIQTTEENAFLTTLPYPYLSTGGRRDDPTGSPDILTSLPYVEKSTERISALENTIGPPGDEEENRTTESSPYNEIYGYTPAYETTQASLENSTTSQSTPLPVTTAPRSPMDLSATETEGPDVWTERGESFATDSIDDTTWSVEATEQNTLASVSRVTSDSQSATTNYGIESVDWNSENTISPSLDSKETSTKSPLFSGIDEESTLAWFTETAETPVTEASVETTSETSLSAETTRNDESSYTGTTETTTVGEASLTETTRYDGATLLAEVSVMETTEANEQTTVTPLMTTTTTPLVTTSMTPLMTTTMTPLMTPLMTTLMTTTMTPLMTTTTTMMTTTTTTTTTMESTSETRTVTGIESTDHWTEERETRWDSTTPTYRTRSTLAPAELKALVKIIFEGTWEEVCPHLSALRRSLADLLTLSLKKKVPAARIMFHDNPCTAEPDGQPITTESSATSLLLYVVDKEGNLDVETTRLMPRLFHETRQTSGTRISIRSFQLVQEGATDSSNAVAVIIVSCVALVCLALLAVLLFVVTSRRTRFNYGERCRPVSLDAYSLDNVSAYSSVRAGRKAASTVAALRASKRSYGNPSFEDSSATPSHPLNYAGIAAFGEEGDKMSEEFAAIPQVTARIEELPLGVEVKNRYANVIPLPETRVPLARISDDPLSEYTNANYVRGPKNATKYYIACQAPLESTVADFWRMIWEQRSKVVIMLTDLVENGVARCAEYVPPSEVTDCHRLYGDFQITLKKRETKDKYAISSIRLKNLEKDTFRDISHIWYPWPSEATRSECAVTLVAVLLEARALQRGGTAPVVVHCSPGTGRTGTLIALDLAMRQYEITRTVDVPRVVSTIRRDRAGAVQTTEQYAIVYEALNHYAGRLAGAGASDS